MQSGPQIRRAGGCLLAVSILAGVALGALYRQPSIGFLAGLAAGLALTGLVWIVDLARRK